MAEVWMYAVPMTITFAGFFTLFVSEAFKEKEFYKPLYYAFIAVSGLLLVDAIFSVHLISQNTTNPDLTPATRAAYLLALNFGGFAVIYVIAIEVYKAFKSFISSPARWFK